MKRGIQNKFAKSKHTREEQQPPPSSPSCSPPPSSDDDKRSDEGEKIEENENSSNEEVNCDETESNDDNPPSSDEEECPSKKQKKEDELRQLEQKLALERMELDLKMADAELRHSKNKAFEEKVRKDNDDVKRKHRKIVDLLSSTIQQLTGFLSDQLAVQLPNTDDVVHGVKHSARPHAHAVVKPKHRVETQVRRHKVSFMKAKPKEKPKSPLVQKPKEKQKSPMVQKPAEKPHVQPLEQPPPKSSSSEDPPAGMSREEWKKALEEETKKFLEEKR